MICWHFKMVLSVTTIFAVIVVIVVVYVCIVVMMLLWIASFLYTFVVFCFWIVVAIFVALVAFFIAVFLWKIWWNLSFLSASVASHILFIERWKPTFIVLFFTLFICLQLFFKMISLYDCFCIIVLDLFQSRVVKKVTEGITDRPLSDTKIYSVFQRWVHS